MREMHKWKDKVELSLDNRQIFFLFFGLSVVGCFVFALGVMVGRRVEFDPEGQVATLAGDSLELLEGQGEGEDAAQLSFKEGLQQPATIGLPETRDPDAPLPTEGEDETTEGEAEQAKAGDKIKTDRKAKDKAKKGEETLASVTAVPEVDLKGKKFTLQMKAFSRKEDAEAFANRLRANGHPVRVESHEVKGRLWHRVRLGAFDEWAEGLAAKDKFEKSEKVIAYVVRI